MKTFFIFLGIVVVLGALAYYFLVWVPSKNTDTSGTPAEGDACTINGKVGTIQGGVCVPPRNSIVDSTPVVLPFKKGDNVYLNPTASFSGTSVASGIPIYRFPVADSAGTYLAGVTRPDWYTPNPIGKYVEQAGSSPYSKVSLINIRIFKFVNGQYTAQEEFLTGDYFIHNKEIQKTAY